MLDIADLKKTKTALLESQALFDAFMDHLPALAFMKNNAGEYIYLNRACHDFYQQAPSERIGKTDQALWPAEIARQIIAHDRQVMENGNVFMGTEIVGDGEKERHHLTTKFPIHREGVPKALGGIALDITDNVRSERDRDQLKSQLHQAQKMEAIGQLAGGIAHDFNNILSAILGYGELIQLEAEKNSATEKYIDGILEAGTRAKDLVEQILFFSRREEKSKHPILLSTIATEAIRLLRASLPTSIDIHTHSGRDLKMVNADVTQMHQLIMNLGTNAGHALSKNGGKLEIILKNVKLDQKTARESEFLPPGWYVKLMVKDNGIGIPPDDLMRIFEPYFTTKEKHEGTGLGLAVVHGIVESHNGKIGVKSAPGAGTVFEVLIPAVEDTIKTKIKKENELLRGNEKVLFIDDEIALVKVGQKMLSRLGYRVDSMTSSIKALDFFRKRASEIDIVITDMTMPEMSGDQLSAELLKIRPDIPIILCTGYNQHISERRAKKIGVQAFMKKPFQIKELAQVIRDVLDGASSL